MCCVDRLKSQAIPVIALNEFVAANRALANSHFRPYADPQENFDKATLLPVTGRWRFYENAVGLDFRVRFLAIGRAGVRLPVSPVALHAKY
jgi:hypothetical protein